MIDYKDCHLLVSVSHHPGNIFQIVLVAPSEYIFGCKLFSCKCVSQRKLLLKFVLNHQFLIAAEVNVTVDKPGMCFDLYCIKCVHFVTNIVCV